MAQAIAGDRVALSWPAIVAAYALTVLSMAVVGAIVPLMGPLAARLGASAQEIGFAIALFSAPSATLAALAGSVVGRLGLKRVILAAAVFTIGGDLLALGASSIAVLYAAMIVAGAGFGAIIVAVPALFIATADGARRQRAMALWATYAPIGFSTGLLLAAPFAGGSQWSLAFWLHAGLTLIAALGGVLLPSVPRQSEPAGEAAGWRGLARVLGILRERKVLRLAVATGLPSAISYGTSLVSPSYLARAHDVTVAMSSTTVAFAKIAAMLIGGLVMGQLLASRLNSLALFAGMALIGLVAQVVLFHPDSGYALAAAALIVWLFAFGGMQGIAMALLPSVLSEPGQAPRASGLIGQFMSLVSFLTPGIYFGISSWLAFVALAAAGLVMSLVLLPAWPQSRAEARIAAKIP